MKTIYLAGDSIRAGYDRYTEQSFRGIAQVFYPPENCQFAAYLYRHFHRWAEQAALYEVDVVHWNAGLWDALRIYGDEPLTPIDVYADYIDRTAHRIAYLYPNAKMIFATSTPVLEEGFIPGYAIRYNRDIEAYNEAALKVLKKYDVTVNDLYGLLKDVPASYHSDQTHFYTAEATKLIGDHVNAVLCEALGIDPASLTPPDPALFASTNTNDVDKYVKVGQWYRPIGDGEGTTGR